MAAVGFFNGDVVHNGVWYGAGGTLNNELRFQHTLPSSTTQFNNDVGVGIVGWDNSGNVFANNLVYTSDVGAADGVCPLDASSRIASEFLPTSATEYKGSFGSAGSTTGGDLPSTGLTNGDLYICDTNGYASVEAGTTFDLGDHAIYNGTSWDKIDNNDAVSSVFGRVGAVIANAGDYDTHYLSLALTTLQAILGDLSIDGNVSLAAGKTFGITSGFQIDASSNLTGVGDVTLEDDKKIALSASGAGITVLETVGNSTGQIFSVRTENDQGYIQIAQVGGSYAVKGSSGVDNLKITDGGILTGGATPPSLPYEGKFIDDQGIMYSARITTSNAYHHRFFGGTQSEVGSIQTNGAATAFNTSSDPRLKISRESLRSDEFIAAEFEKVIDASYVFSFKSDPDKVVIGYDAHKAIDLAPASGLGSEGEGPRDAELGSEYDTGEVDEDGNAIMGTVTSAGVDNGKVSSINALMIEQLLRRVEALEGQLAAK